MESERGIGASRLAPESGEREGGRVCGREGEAVMIRGRKVLLILRSRDSPRIARDMMIVASLFSSLSSLCLSCVCPSASSRDFHIGKVQEVYDCRHTVYFIKYTVTFVTRFLWLQSFA